MPVTTWSSKGILSVAYYGPMLHQLAADHHGRTFFYADVHFDETVRRHATCPASGEFAAADMRDWYATSSRLDWPSERIIPVDSTA